MAEINPQTVHPARINRTKLLMSNPDKFLELFDEEIHGLKRLAERKQLIPVIRPNGTSDVKWGRYGIIQAHPSLQWYDYTKYRPSDRREALLLPNYDLTFSHRKCPSDTVKLLEDGYRVAVTFAASSRRKGVELPEEWYGWPVLNGDLHDLTFKHPQGVVLGLKLKGMKANRKLKDGRLKIGGFLQPLEWRVAA